MSIAKKMTANFDLLLTLNRFHTLFWCFHYWSWTSKCQLGIISESLPIFPRVPETIYEKMFEMCQYVSLVPTILYQLSLLFKVGLSPSKKIVSFKMVKNAFYFTLKAFFVIKISTFLSWLFGHVERGLINFKIHDVTTWLSNTYIAQYLSN